MLYLNRVKHGGYMSLNLLSQKYIEELIAQNIISQSSDVNSQDYEFFEIKGLNASQVRLAVANSPRVCCWQLVGYDERNIWFKLGDRPDLASELEFKSTSWRNDCGKALMYGFSSPAEWIKSELSDFPRA